ncbi:hypothetical protein DSL92_04875 [Billgrantia gudaonensis]|uniref:Uncharacterized protein n=1 Tax=Billgrantia gudaonensis TaxID=376427 RepID=A0A3S0NEV7_9GAMM|nr:hypothetical protein DSL92_04875 [Halomonas gudaonensis]
MLLALNHACQPFGDRRVTCAIPCGEPGSLARHLPCHFPPLIGSHFSPRHPAYVDLADRYPHDPGRARTWRKPATPTVHR